jgi:hypothetical protein
MADDIPTIRTITDPQELLQAQIDEVHVGNLAMREKIKNYRAILKAGKEAEKELRAELKVLKIIVRSNDGNGSLSAPL